MNHPYTNNSYQYLLSTKFAQEWGAFFKLCWQTNYYVQKCVWIRSFVCVKKKIEEREVIIFPENTNI